MSAQNNAITKLNKVHNKNKYRNKNQSKLKYEFLMMAQQQPQKHLTVNCFITQ